MAWKMIDPRNAYEGGYDKTMLGGICGWSALEDANKFTVFDNDNDLYVVYYDDELPYERRKYGVYSLHYGKLCCLLCHAWPALSLVTADPVHKAAYDVYRQAAIDAGFPEVIKHCMTWRELRDTLDELDDRVLDMKALVWCHGDGIDGEVEVTGISCYYSSVGLNDANKDNHISIDIADWED